MKSFPEITFEIRDGNEKKKIVAKPHPEPVKDNMPESYEIAINGFPRGKIKLNGKEWESPDILDQELVDKIGKHIESRFR